MKSFNVTNGKENFILNLPTSLKEITSEYLNAVTSHIEIAPYHAIIGIVYRCKLPELISTSKKTKEMSIAIVPIFVKGNIADDSNFPADKMLKNIKTGDKLVIAGTDIERGYHIASIRNKITIDSILAIYNNDNNFAKNAIKDINYYYFVEFKLVPVNDIKGYYKDNFDDDNFVNPFIKIEESKEQD